MGTLVFTLVQQVLYPLNQLPLRSLDFYDKAMGNQLTQWIPLFPVAVMTYSNKSDLRKEGLF